MVHYKISKLLNDSTASKFVTKTGSKEIIYQMVNILEQTFRFKTSMLRSDLCDYRDAYIVVNGTIDLLATDTKENDRIEKNFAFNDIVSFKSFN